MKESGVLVSKSQPKLTASLFPKLFFISLSLLHLAIACLQLLILYETEKFGFPFQTSFTSTVISSLSLNLLSYLNKRCGFFFLLSKVERTEIHPRVICHSSVEAAMDQFRGSIQEGAIERDVFERDMCIDEVLVRRHNLDVHVTPPEQSEASRACCSWRYQEEDDVRGTLCVEFFEPLDCLGVPNTTTTSELFCRLISLSSEIRSEMQTGIHDVKEMLEISDSGMVASYEVFAISGISSLVKTYGPEGGRLGCSNLSKTVDGVTGSVSFARFEAAASIIPAAVVAIRSSFSPSSGCSCGKSQIAKFLPSGCLSSSAFLGELLWGVGKMFLVEGRSPMCVSCIAPLWGVLVGERICGRPLRLVLDVG
ncbi:hypothetical protein Bca101_033554 [Brassica carinata]